MPSPALQSFMTHSLLNIEFSYGEPGQEHEVALWSKAGTQGHVLNSG